MGQLADLRLENHTYFAICGPNYFCGVKKLPQIGKYIVFLLTNISVKCSHSNFGFWDSFETGLNGISSLKDTYVGKKSIIG